jgi:DNA-binding FadR family transcriptional regulator
VSSDVLSKLRERFPETSRSTERRLPPERQLAIDFGVTRAEIRKALAVMADEGRLERHVGRGTFLRFGDEAKPIDIDELTQRTGPREAMQARLILEPDLAGLAAINASAKQVANLWNLSRLMRIGKTWSEYELNDARFHRLVAEASGNSLLTAVHDVVNRVRRAVIWGWLDTRPSGPPSDYTSFAEHDAICAAIEQRDRLAAAEAMRRHLRTTNARLIGNMD